MVPDVDHVSKETIHALVDFHEGKYTILETYSVLAHQVLAADNLGNEVFLDYICHELNVPRGRINSSNRTQDVKMALRDRMKLKPMVAQLQTVKRCFVCQFGFMSEMEVTAVVACCGRMFHSTCLVGVHTCPFCNEPWGGLPCIVCKKPTCSPHNHEPHVSFEWRRRNRMQCCAVDIHSRCKQSFCPACGSGPTETHDFTTFVMLRREERRNENKRQKIRK